MPRPLPVLSPALHISGILVRVAPPRMARVMEELGRLQGVTVHQTDGAAGKIVVTHECSSRAEAETGVRRIRAVGGVLLAEPVYHYVDPVAAGAAGREGGRHP